jgi:hypothetical protein
MLEYPPGPAASNSVAVGRTAAVAPPARVSLLAGDGYLTGQTINVNGGWYFS